MLRKRLIELRKKANLSQYEIAEKLGFSRGKYANYEQGTRQPDYDTVSKLADFHEVTTDYLLGRSPAQSISEEDNFDPLEELRKYMIENNMQNMDFGFYDIEMWKKLSREDVEDLKKHFDYIYHRATEREKDGED